jgi:hypothetical protein
MIACPKCGFAQDEGPECLRCGVVFARLHPANPRTSATQGREQQVSIGLFRRCFRIVRWLSLAGMVSAIALILYSSPPPQIPVAPEAAHRAEVKIQQFQSSMRQGIQDTLEMDESELNSWLRANLDLKRPDGAPPRPQTADSLIDLAKHATAAGPQEVQELESARSSVRDITMELKENSLCLYATFDLHGMDLLLELEGQIKVQDGYLRLEPTSGKLGSFPLMAGTLEGVANRIFDSPENREKFRLPPRIQDVKIENSKLLVASR